MSDDTVAEYLTALDAADDRRGPARLEHPSAVHSRAPHRPNPPLYRPLARRCCASLRPPPTLLRGPQRVRSCCSSPWSSATYASTRSRSTPTYSTTATSPVCEVDAIVDAGDRWAAFEIKLGASQVDQAAANLTRFSRSALTPLSAASRPCSGSSSAAATATFGLTASTSSRSAVSATIQTSLDVRGVYRIPPSARLLQPAQQADRGLERHVAEALSIA